MFSLACGVAVHLDAATKVGHAVSRRHRAVRKLALDDFVTYDGGDGAAARALCIRALAVALQKAPHRKVDDTFVIPSLVTKKVELG